MWLGEAWVGVWGVASWFFLWAGDQGRFQPLKGRYFKEKRESASACAMHNMINIASLRWLVTFHHMSCWVHHPPTSSYSKGTCSWWKRRTEKKGNSYLTRKKQVAPNTSIHRYIRVAIARCRTSGDSTVIPPTIASSHILVEGVATIVKRRTS